MAKILRGRDLRKLGEKDANAGKPIEAFYNLPIARHAEAARAEYEIGYRAAKAEERTKHGTHNNRADAGQP